MKKILLSLSIALIFIGIFTFFYASVVEATNHDIPPPPPVDLGSITIKPLDTPSLTVHLNNRNMELMALKQEYDAKIFDKMLYMADTYSFCEINYGLIDHHTLESGRNYKTIQHNFEIPELQAEFQCDTYNNMIPGLTLGADQHQKVADGGIFGGITITTEQATTAQSFIDDYVVIGALYDTYQAKVHAAHKTHSTTTLNIIDPPTPPVPDPPDSSD